MAEQVKGAIPAVVAGWFRKGDTDERAARILIRETGPAEATCALMAMWAEKHLRGYLVAKGQNAEAPGEFEALVEACGALDPAFKVWVEAGGLLGKYQRAWKSPSADPPATWDTDQAARTAETLVRMVRGMVRAGA